MAMGTITVNGRDYKEYFPTGTLQYVVTQSLEVAESLGKYDIKVNLDGGGITGQAEALRLAISKALCEINLNFVPRLRLKGYSEEIRVWLRGKNRDRRKPVRNSSSASANHNCV
jgi:small subunit ribosomal protein S9